MGTSLQEIDGSLSGTCKVKICKLKAISEYSRIICNKALLLPPGGQEPLVWRQCWGMDHMKRCGFTLWVLWPTPRQQDRLWGRENQGSSHKQWKQPQSGILRLCTPAQAEALWACSGTQRPTSHLQACWCPKFLPPRSRLLAREADNRHAGLGISGVNLGHAYVLDSLAVLQRHAPRPHPGHLGAGCWVTFVCRLLY